jgi:hypothetical protein
VDPDQVEHQGLIVTKDTQLLPDTTYPAEQVKQLLLASTVAQVGLARRQLPELR